MFTFRLCDISRNFVSNGRKFLCSRNFSKCKEKRVSATDRSLTKLGIPLPPKKPLNSYLRFIELTRPKIVQSQPDLTPTNVIKLIAQEWSRYDPEKKKELQKEYLSEMQIYLEKYEKYKQSITSEQTDLIKNLREQQKHAKDLARLSEKKESLGRPKRPTSAFLRFMHQKKSEKNENVKYNDWLKEIAKEWEALPDQVKEKYREESKLELEKYKSEVIAWEENMIRQGHIDVIRHNDALESRQTKKQTNKTAT